MVRSRVLGIDGFSAHADRTELLSWMGKFLKKPKQVILVHGEEEVLNAFSAEIQEEFGVPTYIPYYLETIELKPVHQELDSTAKALSRMKAKALLQEWLEVSQEFTARLELALLEEDDEDRVAELERELAAVKSCIVENF
jgi:metallo-beta-lactamase family protein